MLTNPVLVSLTYGLPVDPTAPDLATVWLDPEGGMVRIVGELDISNAGAVFEALERRMDLNADLVLELSRLEFIDCFGLRLVSKLARKLEQQSCRLTLRSPRRIVRRAMDVTGLSDHPNIFIEESSSPAGKEHPQSHDGLVRLA